MIDTPVTLVIAPTQDCQNELLLTLRGLVENANRYPVFDSLEIFENHIKYGSDHAAVLSQYRDNIWGLPSSAAVNAVVETINSFRGIRPAHIFLFGLPKNPMHTSLLFGRFRNLELIHIAYPNDEKDRDVNYDKYTLPAVSQFELRRPRVLTLTCDEPMTSKIDKILGFLHLFVDDKLLQEWRSRANDPNNPTGKTICGPRPVSKKFRFQPTSSLQIIQSAVA